MRKKNAQNAWAPTQKMFCVVEAQAPAGSHLVPYNKPKSLGEVTGELAVAGRVRPLLDGTLPAQ